MCERNQRAIFDWDEDRETVFEAILKVEEISDDGQTMRVRLGATASEEQWILQTGDTLTLTWERSSAIHPF